MTTAMRPKQGVEPCQKHVHVQRERQATFYSPAEERVLLAASTKEPEERVCSGFMSEYAYGQ